MTSKRPITPNLEVRADEAHYLTPIRAAVRGAVHFADRMKLPYYKEDVFRAFDVSHASEYRMLRDSASSSRKFHHMPDQTKTRGRNPLISSNKIREMERILEEGIEARSLT